MTVTTGTKNENVIFVGNKPLINYISGVVMQFTTHNAKEVIIKSRGKFISKAVDISEIAKNKFLKELNLKTKDVKIGTEEFESKEGKNLNISTIEITLEKSS
jgi:DNA-binding protein